MNQVTQAEPFLPRPQLGEWLTVDVGAEIQPRKFQAKAREWPHWECVLQMRRGKPPTGTLRAWVLMADVRRGSLQVSLDDFGRLPISERMYVRYEQALTGMIDVLQHDLSDFDLEWCGEVKGMYSRTFKKDQVDWLSVYEILGRPPAPLAREIAEELRLLGRGMRIEDVEMAEQAYQKLQALGTPQLLVDALERLREIGSEVNVGQ